MELCAMAAEEQDPAKLMELVKEINAAVTGLGSRGSWVREEGIPAFREVPANSSRQLDGVLLRFVRKRTARDRAFRYRSSLPLRGAR
jgi:hypothetical protein